MAPQINHVLRLINFNLFKEFLMDFTQLSTTPTLYQTQHKQLTAYDCALVSGKEEHSGKKISSLQKIASNYEKNGEFINAFDLYKVLADNDHDPVSQQRVGAMLVEGKHVIQNKHDGIRYLLDSAEQGNIDAVKKLHEIYIELKPSSEDKGVIHYFCNATLNGDAEAAIVLGRWLLTDRDKAPLAKFLITAATTKSDTDAATALGEWYLNSKDNNLREDAISALKAAGKIAPGKANYILGRVYIFLQIAEEATHYLKLASDSGNTEASSLLGKIYGWEIWVPPLLFPNEENITHIESINIAITHVVTQQTIANKTEWNLSKPLCDPNWEEAEKYLKLAAEAKNPEASYLLGLGYINQNNKEQAYKFIGQAIELAYPQALCLAGLNDWLAGESPFIPAGTYFLERACDKGSEEAKIYLALRYFAFSMTDICEVDSSVCLQVHVVQKLLEVPPKKIPHQLWFSLAVRAKLDLQGSISFPKQRELYRRAYNGGNIWAALDLGEKSLKDGRKEDAEIYFENAIKAAKPSGKEAQIKNQIVKLRETYAPSVSLWSRFSSTLSTPEIPQTFDSNQGL